VVVINVILRLDVKNGNWKRKKEKERERMEYERKLERYHDMIGENGWSRYD